MKTSISLVLLLFLFIPSFSQSVCQGDVVLTDQWEVDSFDCTEVTGTVLITGNGISNLEGLSSLEKVGEHFLIIQANNLRNLKGLENLKHVTCSFEIKENRSILEVSSVKNLKRVGRNLTFSTNPNLQSLQGIEQIDSVYSLQVFGNKQLEYCCELAPIIESNGVYGNLAIGGNGTYCKLNTVDTCEDPSCPGDVTVSSQVDADFFNCQVVEGNLTLSGDFLYFDSLYVLEEVKGDLIIEDLKWVFGVNGLQNLHSVGGDLIIRNNAYLGNVQSLHQLTSVGGDIRIENNRDFSTVRGLENIPQTTDLVVRGNSKLTYCCQLEALASTATGSVIISENGEFCSDTGFSNCDPAPGECLGDVFVQNQYEADNFDCETIRGSFHLVGSKPLEGSGLLKLDTVKGDLYFRIDYSDFNGLTNLKSVDGVFYPTSYLLFGADINLDGLSGLRHLGGINTVLTWYDGQLSNLRGTVESMYLGYATSFANRDWIPHVEQIDSLALDSPSDYDMDVNRLVSALPDDGYLYMSAPYLLETSLTGLSGKTSLNSLTIVSGSIKSLDGMEDLRSVENLRIQFLRVIDDCCGIYNLLVDGSITGDFEFDSWTCTIEEILSGCAPADIPSSVYPNPTASNQVKIRWEGEKNAESLVQVLDNFGKVVMETTLPEGGAMRTAELDISRLPKGTFLVRIITGEKAELRRLVRE